eukprot:2006501-Rhodomonas_salina.4
MGSRPPRSSTATTLKWPTRTPSSPSSPGSSTRFVPRPLYRCARVDGNGVHACARADVETVCACVCTC